MSRVVQDFATTYLTAAGYSVEREVPTGGGRRRCDLLATHPLVPVSLLVEAKGSLGHASDQRSAMRQVRQYAADFETRGVDTMPLIVADAVRQRGFFGEIYVSPLHGLWTALQAMGMWGGCPECAHCCSKAGERVDFIPSLRSGADFQGEGETASRGGVDGPAGGWALRPGAGGREPSPVSGRS